MGEELFALRLLESGPARSLTELHNGEEMYAKLYDLCLKPETYEDRKAQRDEEIAALKAALEMMESEALLQVAQCTGVSGALAQANSFNGAHLLRVVSETR